MGVDNRVGLCYYSWVEWERASKMATVGKQLADQLAAQDGYYADDPRVVRIVEYDNAFGGVSYGIEYKHEVGRYAPSPYVHNPRVYWQAK